MILSRLGGGLGRHDGDPGRHLDLGQCASRHRRVRDHPPRRVDDLVPVEEAPVPAARAAVGAGGLEAGAAEDLVDEEQVGLSEFEVMQLSL